MRNLDNQFRHHHQSSSTTNTFKHLGFPFKPGMTSGAQVALLSIELLKCSKFGKK